MSASIVASTHSPSGNIWALCVLLEASAQGQFVPRFHFHIRCESTGKLESDEPGLVLPDIAAAKAEAMEAARELVIERIRADGRIDCAFEVTDDQGEIVFVLPFRDVIRL